MTKLIRTLPSCILAVLFLLVPKASALTATYNAATDVPVTAASYTATGETVSFTLNYAPTTGTNLTVVNNMGLAFINGTFSNLAQGQSVTLSFGGTNFGFVANYFGGTGNDLVLVWAGNRAVAWGYNGNGALGNNSTTQSTVPVVVDATGVLAGKTVVAQATGNLHSVALCSDGTLVAWGYNGNGQLGNNSTTQSTAPVLVSSTGVLAGKSVISVAAGNAFSMALSADGSVASWGANSSGQLGNNSTTQSTVPVLVNTAGVLAGKSVSAFAAGNNFALALCSDGTLAGWGANSSGQLGNNSTTQSTVPVLVNTAGVLAGKSVVAVGAGNTHSLALCSDGTLTAWGTSSNGQLGNGGTTQSTVPVAVTTASLAPGERFTQATSGAVASHSLGLIALALTPVSTTLAATTVSTTGITLNGTVNARGSSTTTAFEYGLTTAYGATVAATPSPVSGTSTTAVSAVLSGLPPGTLYHYRTSAANGAGTATGSDMTFTTAMDVNATWSAAGDVPVTAASFTAQSASVNFTLNFAPATGTTLMVVKNTGQTLINGQFTNLVQGQAVALSFGGATYNFVANYFGGTGNDLVLQWAGTRALAWGDNQYGQLGTGSATPSKVPAQVITSGALAGKTVTKVVAGFAHSLALCSDGTVAAWGYNFNGQLGNNSTAHSVVPVAVITAGVLSGKTVIDIAAGENFSLALCSDGTLAAWGLNSSGQLGNNSTTSSAVPVLVTQTGVLAGRTVVAIGAGGADGIVLCADGTLATWGSNSSGQLGNGSTTQSTVPVLVTQTGVLAGKTVMAVASGMANHLALCSDGTVAAWGQNGFGQLGDNSTTQRTTPVLVSTAGVLAGKTVISVGAGQYHSLALCSDGTLATWGYNFNGQLGNNSTTQSNVPVLVNTAGVLAAKTVTAVSGGQSHSLVLCSDGTLATWGLNSSGQLGNNSTTQSLVPVAVDMSALASGARFMSGVGGSLSIYSLGLVGEPPTPTASTLAAASVTNTSATLNGSVNANGNSSTVSFDYGLTTAYGTTVTGTPSPVTGTSATAVSAALTGLTPGTIYHYRVRGSSVGTANGNDVTFTTLGNVATLSGIGLSSGSLSPVFASGTTTYTSTTSSGSITVTPAATQPQASVTVNGNAVASGAASSPISLSLGSNTITIVVTSSDGTATQTYTINVTRTAALTATFNTSDDVPESASLYTATGSSVNLTLNFAPLVGASLTVVKNTGLGFINGTFSNLAQGQVVTLGFGGINYSFRANYYGGTGNDLVLQWLTTRPVAWGYNANGTLGNGTSSNSLVPTSVTTSGVLAGKTIIAESAGALHSLALCTDGTLAAWGFNNDGALGNNSTTSSNVPVLVSMTGALAGKTVIAVAAGSDFSLVLCSDGTLATWGANNNGQLGNSSTATSTVPVPVSMTGVLAGKTVTAIAAGESHSLVLCSDGTLVTWGAGNDGQLGNLSTTFSSVPVLVDTSGVLAGKAVTAISAGGAHNLVLCSDGTLAAWGRNYEGELGNTSTTTTSLVPLLVNTSGVLAGKTITFVTGAYRHSLALCSDGTLAAWGSNGTGQLGNGTTTSSTLPVLVNIAGVLSGRTVTALFGGSEYSVAQCSDGTVATWGGGGNGALGNNNIASSSVPVLVSTSAFPAGERFAAVTTGSSPNHVLGMVAAPLTPAAVTLAATALTNNGGTLNGTVNANANSTDVTFEYGLTTAYGTTVSGTPTPVSGTSATAVSATISGLASATTYHYRVNGVNAVGSGSGADQTFTTLSTVATLSGLTLSGGSLSPSFASGTLGYTASLSNAAISLTPTVTQAQATVQVNGSSVASGSASAPIALSAGLNTINVVVTAQDGVTTQTYTIAVTRSALAATFNTATDIGEIASLYAAAGNTASFTLNFAPATGTNLMAVKNTGRGFIIGQFSNLAQGQSVVLSFGGISYSFVANYFGGTGNDLVLQWANARPLAWGVNTNGQLGNNSTTTPLVPVAVTSTGLLAGKTIIAEAAGGTHSLALCADGTLAAWGANTNGQLGNNSTTQSIVPVAVTTSGVLAGKTIVALSAGANHSLALCSDGTVAAWGLNTNGQLGDGTTTQSPVPVLVNLTGVLAGKTVVAIAAGASHNLVLCADGTLATWGLNTNGQLGNNSTTQSLVPVLVTSTGVLAGRSVTAIASGSSFCAALASDGRVVAWGRGSEGQLGNGNGTQSLVPVLVTNTGVLAGKTVVSIATGSNHTLALCSDSTVFGWGFNLDGELGDGSNNLNQTLPVALTVSGVLAGKTISAVTAATNHSVFLCTDGTVAACGAGAGRLGNNASTGSNPPVLVNTSALTAGERFVAVTSGFSASHTLALVATPPQPPAVSTLAALSVANTTATLNGGVNANGNDSTVSFEYGLTTSYGSTVAASPATVTGSSTTAVSAAIAGLTPGTTYHYRVKGVNVIGTTNGTDATFTTLSNVSTLASLNVSSGTLSPAFASGTNAYTSSATSSTVIVTPTATQPQASVTVNGSAVAFGAASSPIALNVGANTITIVVTSSDGTATQTYTVVITRSASLTATFNASSTVPETVSSYNATGNTVNLALNYAPAPGTSLTVVKNTGLSFISGRFSSLAQGQLVALNFGGISYNFVANYYGGTGNDLVLQWADTKAFAWGNNANGQLGINSTSNSLVPVAVTATGALAGKVVIAQAGGSYHSLNLCSDGTITASGYNGEGELGNNSTTQSTVPVAVFGGTALLGRSVVALSCGEFHSLALCSDGRVASWGRNTNGQLGNGTTTHNTVPVLVTNTGVLSGKTVIAISAGGSFSLALCSDGTLAAWGYNGNGQLGNNSTTTAGVPVLVNTSGVLTGKTVIGIASGGAHSLALCSDGTLAAWGSNGNGQLGNNSTTDSLVPTLVTTSGVLAGKTITSVACGYQHSFASCSDGTLAAWGYNPVGNLGNNSTTQSTVPVLISSTSLAPGEQFIRSVTGSGSFIGLALAATLPPPVASTLAASAVTNTSATMNGSVNANHASNSATVSFEYGLTTAYGSTISATPSSVSGTSSTAVNSSLSGLTPGTIYHYRVKAVSAVGASYGVDQTFATTSGVATLAGLTLSAGTLSPGFSSGTFSYNAGSTTSAALLVTPIPTQAQASVTVNGGATSTPVNLSAGANMITLIVTSSDNTTTQIYTVSINRSTTLTATFNAASDVPETVSHYTATGNTVNLALNYAPTTGTNLTIIKNTGNAFINGAFNNLAQGQSVTLNFGGITYSFIATYFGGTGNDLVLQWANTRLLAWGFNISGQLGNNSTTDSFVPLAVTSTGVLAGKTIVAARGGSYHSIALSSDGSVATWGMASGGQLGNNSLVQRSVPGGIYTADLTGKTIVATSTGSNHTLALCSDGTVVGWGQNGLGQLGNGSNGSVAYPVFVNTTGVLAGKTVTSVAAGANHSLALCADGTLISWGSNANGELGNNSITSSNVPVLVSNTGVLAGKTVIAITAGANHSLALCSDGTLAAWGYGGLGELGNNSSLTNLTPVLVATTGVLAGKIVVSIASGGDHNLALCSDGTLVSWGYNIFGALGNNSTTASYVPVAVNTTGALSGKTVISLGAGSYFSLALCSDGTLASWGYNSEGELGNNSTTQSNVPVLVNTSALQAGEKFIAASAGPSAFHSLAIVAAPPPAIASTLAATAITSSGATLNGSVNANGLSTTVSFDYGLTTSYGSSIAATPSNVTGTGATNVNAVLSSLAAGLYHFRVRAVNSAGTVLGGDLNFNLSTPVQTWRQTYFGTTNNSGNTADAADFDLDGIKNVLEFAFGTNPTTGLGGSLIFTGNTINQHGQPVVAPNGAGFNAVFLRRLDRVAAGLTYTVEFSANLIDWESSATEPTVIATDAEVDVVSVPFPALLVSGLQPKFFRVTVSIAP